MELPFIDGPELERLLPMGAAVDVLQAAFGAERPSDAPLRTHLETEAGELYLMPAAGPAGVGVKLVTLAPANPDQGLPFIHALYVLFSARSMEPVAAIDGATLTGLRTAAVSGLATRHLARPDARRLVLFGAGVQATFHLDAMRAVRPVDEVVVVSRSPGPVGRLVDRARAFGLAARAGTPEDVALADLVCTCTTSATPVFDGTLLAPGAHVNGIGSYRPGTRELDDATMARGRLVVEARTEAWAEAGDLIIPMRAGLIDHESVAAELGAVVRGMRVRQGPEDITVFKSVGVAFEDLAVAAAAVAARG